MGVKFDPLLGKLRTTDVASGGSATWGNIVGTLSDQTDLQSALDAKENSADLATVATTGAYSDLTGKPTLGTLAALNSVDLTANVGSTVLPIANGGTGSATQNFVDLSTSQTKAGALVLSTASATALTVGPNGTTNPVLQVDASTASQATGVSIKGAAAGSPPIIAATSSATNENISIFAKGTGNVVLGSGSVQSTFITGTFRPGVTSAGGNVNPLNTNTYGLGTSSLYWQSGFVITQNFNSTASISGSSPGQLAVTGKLMLPAGTTSVGPLNIATGTLQTASTAGDIEFDGTSLFFTGTSRQTVMTLAQTQTATGAKTFSSSITANGNVRFGITARTTNTTLSTSSSPIQKGDATSGAITLTLAAANAGAGNLVMVTKIDSTANAVTIAGGGTDTIAAGTSYLLNKQYDFVILASDGTSAWYPLAGSNVRTAATLATARTIQTNLASTSSASFDGSANITPGVTGVLGASNGGAGTTNGIMKADGSGNVSAAASGTDYAPATSGSGILKGNGSGGFSTATADTDYTTPAGTETFTNKTYNTAGTGNVFKINGTTVSAVTGSGSAVLGTAPAISAPAITGAATADGFSFNNNTVTVTSNAGTCSAGFRLNTFTNSSAATMAITISTSGAVDGQAMIVRIYDFSAVAQTIGWTNTENSTVSAPTTSNGSTTLPLTVGFMYNVATSKWRCVAVS